MIEDQIRILLVSFVVMIGAAVTASLLRRQLASSRYFLRAIVGALVGAVGIFVVVFVLSGFGWGWFGMSRSRETQLIFGGGLFVGLLHATFGWIVSRKILPLLVADLVLANIAVLMVPTGYEIWRASGFVLSNYVLLCIWLAKTEPKAGPLWDTPASE